MNMMYHTTGPGLGSGFIVLWALHVLAVIAFFVGALFLIWWALKTLSNKQLKHWGIWLVVLGTLVCLVTIGMRGAPWMGNGDGLGGKGSVRMMQWNANGTLPTGMMENGMGMSMMLKGKTGEDFDKAFITLMIPHHQDAINMANDALKNASHAEMKKLARDIITAQQKEIDMMKAWQKSWGYTK